MVVVCESCSTRFRIDDARIPAKGRLVRCSQCKATFIAKPQDATFEETVEEVVAEVTGSGGAPVPEPASDLFDTGGEDLGETASRPGVASDEERWEFDEEPRKSAAEPLDRGSFGKSAEPESTGSALDDIGDPMEWDLLRGSVEREAREAEFVEPPPPPPPPRTAAKEAAAEPFLRPLEPEPAAPARAPRRAPVRSLGQWAKTTLNTCAWLALVALASFGAGPLWPREAATEAARPAARTIGLADGEARGVRASFLENAFAPLYVVQGELARPNPDPRLGLRVHLVAADGARVGDATWAGVSRTPQELRERTPEALRAELSASAAAAARGGRFVAVFAEVPAQATGFGLSLEPLPDAPPETQEAAPEATASSPPSPLPSSE